MIPNNGMSLDVWNPMFEEEVSCLRFVEESLLKVSTKGWHEINALVKTRINTNRSSLFNHPLHHHPIPPPTWVMDG